MGDILQQNGLAGARRRDDKPAAPMPAPRSITRGDRSFVVGTSPFGNGHLISGVDYFKNLMADLPGRRTPVDLQQGKITLAFLGATDRAFNSVTVFGEMTI